MERASTGIAGLDLILKGGWPTGRMMLVVGSPGTGKTTLGFQFLLEGARRGEKVLYITLSESADELRAVAASHGWSLDGIEIFELDAAESVLGLGDAQTIFDPSDVEFRATSRAIMAEIDRVGPTRLVFDSLTELAFLARDPLAFRRELLLLKQNLMRRATSVLLVSDGTAPDADRHLHSLAHGVLEMQEMSPEYGPERRRLRIRKVRGASYLGGYHDFKILRGGLEVYPRLVAADEVREPSWTNLESGIDQLDQMLGGGLTHGTSTLFMGPAGSGKSSVVASFVHNAAINGQRAAVFMFDEEIESFLYRTDALGMPLREHVEAGTVELHQIDPAQLSPGEFVNSVKLAVSRGASFIALDSLNGYVYSMPEERFLSLQLHELLSYLSKRGVATALVLAQAGLVGHMSSPADITYVADAVVLFRLFEAEGRIRRAVSMFKKRSGRHSLEIRELQFGERLEVGQPLAAFRGILTGTPDYVGDGGELMKRADPRDAG